MNVLVVGSGGREHALVKFLKASRKVDNVFCWPGNDGIFVDAHPAGEYKIDAQPAAANEAIANYAALVSWAKKAQIHLCVIGPEKDLVAGLADQMRKAGISVFGPGSAAAKLEGSKIFAKEFMQEFGVPTARAVIVDSVQNAIAQAKEFHPPYVLKAEGLAAGKGVFICATKEELKNAASDLFEKRIFGEAGERALLEEFHTGTELSVLVLTNGESFEVLPYCRDHKRLLDGNKGPNTGGMGVVGPIHVGDEIHEKIIEQVVRPTLAGLKNRAIEYRGVIFIGLILSEAGPITLEYNVRFGDPEAQVLLPLLKNDGGEVLNEIANGRLPPLSYHDKSICCVVLAAQGYPEKPILDVAIEGDIQIDSHSGLANDQRNVVESSYVLHAATKKGPKGFVTNGGRVLNVIGFGSNLERSIQAAYNRAMTINWPGMQMRRDIGRN